MLDVSNIDKEPKKLRLFIRSFKMMINYKQTKGTNYGVSILTYSSKDKTPSKSTSLSEKQKRLIAITNNVKIEGITPFNKGLMKAYELASTNSLPGGNCQVILAADGKINDNEKQIKEITNSYYEDNNITFSILSLGRQSWKEDRKMKNLIPRGGGHYYKIDPVRFIDNWSATFQLGTSVFRGDIDKEEKIDLPGQI